MTRWQRLFPFLQWPRPDAALLRGEALAGLTVGLMVIPQGVAYAALAGMRKRMLDDGRIAPWAPAVCRKLLCADSRAVKKKRAPPIGGRRPGRAQPSVAP